MEKLDIGGLLITLWSLFTNARKINDIKLSFVNNVLDNALKKEEDEVQEQMAKLGFSIYKVYMIIRIANI